MPSTPPSGDPIHRYSTLGRPLDPTWPTNRAVLALVPVGAVAAAVVGPAASGLATTTRAWAAALGAATILGAWALGRELAPDDQRAAFIAMALGFGTLVVVPGTSLVLLFATLMLTRVVNRTVGLPARTLDNVVVLALGGWAASDTGSPGVGIMAALGFALDAMLPEGRRTQWGFAALSLVMVAALAVQEGSVRLASRAVELHTPGPSALACAAIVASLFLLAMARTRALSSTCDATGEHVSARRMRWAMAVALLIAAQGLFVGKGGAEASSLVWAVLAGVGLSGIVLPGTKPMGRYTSSPW